MATIEAGGYFGELALIQRRPRAASILAETDCHLASIDKHTYNLIKKSHQNILGKKI